MANIKKNRAARVTEAVIGFMGSNLRYDFGLVGWGVFFYLALNPPATSQEIQAAIGIPQQTLSRHLMALCSDEQGVSGNA